MIKNHKSSNDALQQTRLSNHDNFLLSFCSPSIIYKKNKRGRTKRKQKEKLDKKKKENNETNYEEGHCFKPLYKAIRGGSCAPDGPYQQRVSVLSWPVLGRVTATVKDSLWSVMPTPNADGTRRGTPSHELPIQPRVSKYLKSSADLRVKKMGRTHSVLLCLIDGFFRRGRKWHSFEIGRNRS